MLLKFTLPWSLCSYVEYAFAGSLAIRALSALLKSHELLPGASYR